MSKLPAGTLTGYYPQVGDILQSTSASLHELGSDPYLLSNLAIIDYAREHEVVQTLPWIVSSSIAKVLHERKWDANVVHVYKGVSADNLGENLGTYGELKQLKDYAADHPEHNRPAFVTSGYNIGNILRQARLLEIEGDVPADLPRVFDWHSKQLWTKHKLLWALTAKLRLEILERKGH